MKILIVGLAASFSLVFLATPLVAAGWQVDLESGAVFNGYNDVRIPNEGGTQFSLSEDFNSEPEVFWRLRVSKTFGERHTLSLLAAPLTLQVSGEAPRAISFEGVSFPAGESLIGTFRFDSYRLTYRYRLVESERLTFGLGFTGKIRDAAISLESDSLFSEKTNVGFVPLVNFRLSYLVNPRLTLLFAGDALAAPQGRAEDVLLAAQYQLTRGASLRVGYRVLEGGADVDEVYNFAFLHYLVFGVSVSF